MLPLYQQWVKGGPLEANSPHRFEYEADALSIMPL